MTTEGPVQRESTPSIKYLLDGKLPPKSDSDEPESLSPRDAAIALLQTVNKRVVVGHKKGDNGTSEPIKENKHDPSQVFRAIQELIPDRNAIDKAVSIMKEMISVDGTTYYDILNDPNSKQFVAFNNMLNDLSKVDPEYGRQVDQGLKEAITKSQNRTNNLNAAINSFSDSSKSLSTTIDAFCSNNPSKKQLKAFANEIAADLSNYTRLNLASNGVEFDRIKNVAQLTNSLTNTIRTEILSSNNHKTAVAKLTLFAEVAKVSLTKGDFNTTLAINTGLQQNEISRLKLNDSAPTDTYNFLQDLEKLCSPLRNFGDLRKEETKYKEEHKDTPIPAIPCISKDLFMSDESVASVHEKIKTKIDLVQPILKFIENNDNELAHSITTSPKTTIIDSMQNDVKLSPDQSYELSNQLKRPAENYDKKAFSSDSYQKERLKSLNKAINLQNEEISRQRVESAPATLDKERALEGASPITAQAEVAPRRAESAPANMENQFNDTNIKKDNQNIEATESAPKQQKEETPSNDSEPLKRSPKVPPLDLKNTKSKQETKVPRLPNVQDLKASDLTFTNPPIKQEKASPDSKEQAKTASQDARSIIPEGRTRSLTSLWESKIKQSRGQNSQSKQENKNDSVSVTTRPKIK